MRGVAPLFGLALAISATGFASAASSADGSLDLDDRVSGLLPTRAAFDLLLLPEGVTTNLGLDPQTSLPGPNAPLNARLDLLLLRLDPGLPDVGLSDLGVLAASGATWTPTGSVDGQGAASAVDAASSIDEGAADNEQASGSPGNSETLSASGDDASTNSASTSSPPSTTTALREAWSEMGPAGKTALAAGALGTLLIGPLAMYSRIQRGDALKNDTRRKIYEIVEASPGVCIKDVAERSAVSYSTASYHLDRLVKTGFLVATEQGNRVLYYKNGGTFSRDERELVPILKNEECMRVFNHILENPWCYRAEVAQALGVSHTTVNWHLKRLTDAGLVDEHREGRNCHLFIDQPALDRILEVLDKMDQIGCADEVTSVETAVAA